jgi:hypothetical protein
MAEPFDPVVDASRTPATRASGIGCGPSGDPGGHGARSGVARAPCLGWATRPARAAARAGAVGCAVAGSWLLWGLGWALLAAVPFLLLLDARTPRG